jgi:tetratricopeptide (TPR) repeat protein
MLETALAMLMLIQVATQPAPKDEVKESLARAEALYYEARFSDSIQLLTKVNDDLQAKPDRLADKINTKLQLALANIGLNDTDKAKVYLVEMFTLDPNTALDAQQFSPKVITLATDAKAEMVRVRCQAIGEDAKNSLKTGNAAAVRRLIGSADSKCVDMAAIGPDAADLLYKTGMEAYKNSDFSNALQNFQAALKFAPKHEMANQYSELAQGRLQVAEDQTLLNWQKNFDAHNLKDAAVDYRKLVSFNDSKSTQAARQAGDQYRKTLTKIVETWNQTCPAGDDATMNSIRSQILELLPDPAFGADIRALMMPCDKTALKAELPAAMKAEPKVEPKPEIKPSAKTVSLNAPANSCLALDYRVAMTRLKTRVDPDIPREARPYIQGSQVTLRVKVRIDDGGNVVTADIAGGNPMLNSAVKNAVLQWRFSSAMDTNGARCVDTEIPIVLGPLSAK